MNSEQRRWWPFNVQVTPDKQSSEVKLKLAFLREATDRGLKAYLQNNELECGAVADDGKECLLAWRGKQRTEMFLMESGKLVSRKLYTDHEEGAAFLQASAKALDWIGPKQEEV